jgi:hypothetical protein
MVSPSEAEAFAHRHSLSYLEVSAFDGKNVTETFHRLAREIQANVKKGRISGDFQIPKAPEVVSVANKCFC